MTPRTSPTEGGDVRLRFALAPNGFRITLGAKSVAHAGVGFLELEIDGLSCKVDLVPSGPSRLVATCGALQVAVSLAEEQGRAADLIRGVAPLSAAGAGAATPA